MICVRHWKFTPNILRHLYTVLNYRFSAHYSLYTNWNLNPVPVSYEARVPPTRPPKRSLLVFDCPRHSDEFRTTLTVFHSVTPQDYYDIRGVLDHSEGHQRRQYFVSSSAIFERARTARLPTNQPQHTIIAAATKLMPNLSYGSSIVSCEPGQRSRHSHSLRARRSWDRLPRGGGAYSAPVQTGPGAHPASYTMGKVAGVWHWWPTHI
jgi:hypothetical protein